MSDSLETLIRLYTDIQSNVENLHHNLGQLNWKSFIKHALLNIKTDIIKLKEKEQQLKKANDDLLLQIHESSKQLAKYQSQHIIVDILHLDEQFCIVNKPANICIDGDEDVTLEKLTLNTLRNVSKIRHCHQLDRATSGILIYALTRKAAAKVSALFQNREVIKVYYAIVHGHVPLNRFIIDVPLTSSPNDPIREMIANPTYPGRAAVTECTVQKRGYWEGKPVSLIKVHLHTGRRHQIRLHLSHCGHPIVGDPTYSNHPHQVNVDRMYLDSHQIILNFKNEHKSIDVSTNSKYIFDQLIEGTNHINQKHKCEDVALFCPEPHSLDKYHYSLIIPFVVEHDATDIKILIKKSNQLDMFHHRKPRSQTLKAMCWNFVCEARLQSGHCDAAQTISQTLFSKMPQFASYLIDKSTFVPSEFRIDSRTFTDEHNAKYLAHHLASNLRRGSMHHCTILCAPYVIFMAPFENTIINDTTINQNRNMQWCSLRSLSDEILCYSPLHLISIKDKKLQMDPLLHFVLSNDCISSQKWVKNHTVRCRFTMHTENDMWMERYQVKRKDNEPIRVLDNVGIYVGSIKAAKNIKRLKELNITHIIDCTASHKEYITNDGRTRLCIPVQDAVTQNIVQYMDECLQFITHALDAEKHVLVHCWQGASRSVTIIIGYLMKYHQMKLKDALDYIAQVRGAFAKPNTGFLLQLIEMEKRLFHCNSFNITTKQMERYQRKHIAASKTTRFLDV
eukprot:204873_1